MSRPFCNSIFIGISQFSPILRDTTTETKHTEQKQEKQPPLTHIYVHIYTHTYIHIHTHIYIYPCIYTYICIHTRTHTHTYTHPYIRTPFSSSRSVLLSPHHHHCVSQYIHFKQTYKQKLNKKAQFKPRG